MAGEPRLIAVEHAARYRDALGTPLPPGLPEALLEPVADARRGPRPGATRARTGRSPTSDVAMRFGLGAGAVSSALLRARRNAAGSSRARSGPAAAAASGATRSVLRSTPPAIAGAAATGGRAGRAAPCSAGFSPTGTASAARAAGSMRCSTPSSSCRACRSSPRSLEHEILPARLDDYAPSQLDTLSRRGEVRGWASSRSASATAASRST